MLTIKKYLGYIAVLAVLSIIVFHHRHVLSYALQWSTFRHLETRSLAENFLVTPALFCAFVATFWVAGTWFLRLISKEGAEWGNTLWHIALGMGLCNLLFLVFGFLGILYAPVTAAVLVTGCILALFEPKTFGRKGLSALSAVPRHGWALFFVTLLGLAVFNNLLTALAPPVYWDALAYHLAIPELYARTHRVFAIPWLIQKQCYTGMEMLSAAAFTLGNERVPQLFTLLAEALLIGGMARFAGRYFSNTSALISSTLFAFLPVSLELGGAATNDFSLALFSCCSLFCFWEYIQGQNRQWLFLTAAFSAFTIETKFLGLVTFSWIAFVFALLRVRGTLHTPRRDMLLAGGILVVLGSGVFARNYVWTGNPLFPFFQNLFGGNLMDPATMEKLKNYVRLSGLERTPLNFLLLPYYLITRPGVFQYNPQYLVFSAVCLAAVRCFRKGYSRIEVYLVSFIFYFVLVWFVFGWHLWRFLIPVLPLGILLLVSWWEQIRSRGAKAVLALVLALNLVPLGHLDMSDRFCVVFGLPPAQARGLPGRAYYLIRYLNQYVTYDYINAMLPENAKILLFREIRGYYLNRPYIWGDPLNQSVIMYEKYANAEELRTQLASLGVTHVIVNNALYAPSEEYYDEHTVGIMGRLLTAYGTPVFSWNGVDLYRID